MRKTDYFGTFLDTLNSSSVAPRGPAVKGLSSGVSPRLPEAPVLPEQDLETILRALPDTPGAEMSIVDLAKTLGFGLARAAAALKLAETNGLVRNNRGQFSLTDLGRQAASQSG